MFIQLIVDFKEKKKIKLNQKRREVEEGREEIISKERGSDIHNGFIQFHI